jgi:Rieske Fe-S protein
VGGEDHKVGSGEDTEAAYRRLEEYAASRFGPASVACRWSGQIIEPVDGLPFLGLNPFASHVYVATGFAGNGITFGTCAASVVTELILGRSSPYTALYSPSRMKPIAGVGRYLSENVDFPRHLVVDRLTNMNATAASLDAVPPGEGRIVALNGHKYAVYRAPDGELHSLSPVCTHLGCDVRWNRAEASWDCPCHGSRFAPDGKVLNGPAVHDLPPKTP